MSTDLTHVRNIGIAAHIDAGKTTTTERVLYYTGKTHRMGEVDEGTTTTDFDEEEQKRGITIYSAAVTCPWKGHTINLIDTPGHVDFTAEVERSMRVLDGLVIVFDAREGVEAQSETVWRQADKYKIPRICFLNKMDRIGADFEHSVTSIRERLSIPPLPIQFPMGASDTLEGIVDVIDMKAVYFNAQAMGTSQEEREIPEAYQAQARQMRHHLIEMVSEFSDSIMEKYLADQPIEKAELLKAIRTATIKRSYAPVLCGSSLKYIGVQRMLDAICDFLPSPLEVPPVIAKDARREGVEHKFSSDPKGDLVTLVFKVIAEKPMDLYFLRVYSGTLKPNSRLLNTATGEKENLSRIYRMFAKRRDQLDLAVAGDIVAVVGPRHSLTGHTLCDPQKPVLLESIEFPETVISVSIEPKSSRDRDKLMECLAALRRQDPTLQMTANVETGQTLLSGMGELHLEVAVNRLRNDMNVDVAVGKPRVSYRETVSGPGQGVGQFNRQIGGKNHSASLTVRLEPRKQVAGTPHFQVVNALPAETLLKEYSKAAELGIMEAAQSGILGGYAVIDWKATIIGAVQHETESSEVAFENAARLAFYDAMKVGGAVLLQPIMAVEVVTPDDYFGSIMSDLNARKAVVRDTSVRGMNRIIDADVPLSQMFGYVTKLRSLSQGRATASMAPSHYAPVPAAETKALVG